MRKWAARPGASSGQGGDISEGPGQCLRPWGGEGGLTYCLRRSSLPRALGDDFSVYVSPLSLLAFGLIIISSFFVFVPFQDKCGTVFGAACVGDVPDVIYFVIFRGVLLYLCHIVRIQDTTPPHPPHWRLLGHAHVCQRHGVFSEGKYLFILNILL